MTKVKKQSVYEGMVEEFISKMKTFSLHLFNAKWQYDMYKQLIRDIPVNTAVFCMDYAENFTCKAQDAPQGFHWSNINCIIHPIVANYICNEWTRPSSRHYWFHDLYLWWPNTWSSWCPTFCWPFHQNAPRRMQWHYEKVHTVLWQCPDPKKILYKPYFCG